MGYATPGDLDVGYIDGSVTSLFSEDLDVGDFSPSAFSPDSNANLAAGCRTAVNPFGGRSAADKMADKVGGTSKGSSVRTYYPGGVASDAQLLQKNNGNVVEIQGRNRQE